VAQKGGRGVTTIKEFRTAAEMTQQAFSEYLGIPRRTIEDWESNRRKCPPYLLSLIAYKLKKENLIK
jgi:DNA-binding transcriptional regulator YiaG